MPEERSDKPEYKLRADDPYKILAFSIIVHYPPEIVKRLMKDTKFLRREITREVRGQDFRGYFVDCLFVSICEGKRRMDLMRALDAFSRYLYSELDLERMREEVKNAYEKLGLGDILEEDNG